MPSWCPWSRARAAPGVCGAPSSQLLNSCPDPAAAARPREAARSGRVPASSSLGRSAFAPCAPHPTPPPPPAPAPRKEIEGTGVGTRSWLATLGSLGAGSSFPPLAHHGCGSSSSSTGRRPRGSSAQLLPEPGDQLRKVAAPICWNVSLIRPLVR